MYSCIRKQFILVLFIVFFIKTTVNLLLPCPVYGKVEETSGYNETQRYRICSLPLKKYTLTEDCIYLSIINLSIHPCIYVSTYLHTHTYLRGTVSNSEERKHFDWHKQIKLRGEDGT